MSSQDSLLNNDDAIIINKDQREYSAFLNFQTTCQTLPVIFTSLYYCYLSGLLNGTQFMAKRKLELGKTWLTAHPLKYANKINFFGFSYWEFFPKDYK